MDCRSRIGTGRAAPTPPRRRVGGPGAVAAGRSAVERLSLMVVHQLIHAISLSLSLVERLDGTLGTHRDRARERGVVDLNGPAHFVDTVPWSTLGLS